MVNVFLLCNTMFAIVNQIWCYEWGHRDLLFLLHTFIQD